MQLESYVSCMQCFEHYLVFLHPHASLHAADAGSVLYGGAVDYCKLTDLGSYSSGEVFDKLVKIENGNANSSISSDPFRICPCENNHPNYSKSHKSYRIHPGETFYMFL